MKIRKLLIAVALFTFFISARAFSQLGETPQEVQARYGPGKNHGARFRNGVSIKYGTKGFEIDVHFLDGKSVAEQFKKHSGGKWSDQEILDFLKTYPMDGGWTYSEPERLWYNANKVTVAFREPGHPDWFWIEDREKVRANAALAPARITPKAAPAPLVSAESLQQAAEIVKANHNDLVFVTGKDARGSGFIASMGGANFLVTNAHVAADISGAAFKTLDGTTVQGGAATVAVGEDVFRMELPAGGAPLEMMQGVDENAGIGDEVVVLGNAEGAGVINTIMGKITGVGPNLVEVDAPFVPGNSGSPIIHLKTGKVIGVATYLVVQDYDATTNEKMKAPVIRRFGYRLDGVKTWQPVAWQPFYAQAAIMQNVETLTADLGDFFRDLAENKGMVTPGRHTNPVIKFRIEQWIAGKNRRSSDIDQANANANFASFLKVACQTDVTAAQRQLTYDYFQRDLADQQAIRNEMSKAFEELIKLNRN